MESRKAAVYSCGRAHFAEGLSGECYPSIFLPRKGNHNESPSEVYEDVHDSVEHFDNKEYENAVLCESLYLSETASTQKRYEKHLEILLESSFERVFVINSPMSALYGVGLVDGIVADLGCTQASVLFSHNSEALVPPAYAKNFGRDYFNIFYGDDNEEQSACSHTESLSSCTRTKEKIPQKKPTSDDTEVAEHVLPDGNSIHEKLMPNTSAFDSNPLEPLIKFFANSCEEGINKICSQNRKIFESRKDSIVLSGGICQFPDFIPHAVEEINRLSLKVGVFNPACMTGNDMRYQPQALAYKGASILGEYLGQSSYISRKEFFEQGERIVAVKCMSIL